MCSYYTLYYNNLGSWNSLPHISSQVVLWRRKKNVFKNVTSCYSVDVLPVTSKQPSMMYHPISSSFATAAADSSVYHNSTSTSDIHSSLQKLRSSSNEDPTTDPTGVYSIIESRELTAMWVNAFMHLINGNNLHFNNTILSLKCNSTNFALESILTRKSKFFTLQGQMDTVLVSNIHLVL